MSKGYLQDVHGTRLQAWFDQGGARPRHLHTSGHAAPVELQAFARAIKPKALVPIHGVRWDEQTPTDFPPIRRLKDGEPWEF